MRYTDFLGKRFLIIIFVAAVIYSIFLVFSDISSVYEKMSKFDFKFLPLILVIVFSSWMILFLRWLILLKKQEIIGNEGERVGGKRKMKPIPTGIFLSKQILKEFIFWNY